MPFNYRSPVTIDHTKVPSTLTDFPVLISITDARLKTTGNGGHVASSSGFDIRPFTSNTLASALTFELNKYVSTTGELEMWVKQPSLSSSVDTVIWLGYGNSSIVSDGSSTATWDSNYVAVYHFGDGTTLSLADSTSGANTLTNNNAVTATSGQVAGAANFVAASSQFLTHASFSLGATDLTVEAWTFSTNYNADMNVVEKDPINGEWEIFYETSFGTPGLKLRAANPSGTVVASFPSNSNWHYIVGTITGTTGVLFTDGAQVATAGLITGIPNTSSTVRISNHS